MIEHIYKKNAKMLYFLKKSVILPPNIVYIKFK